MADKKRKSGGDSRIASKKRAKYKPSPKTLTKKSDKGDKRKRRSTGPRLPNSLRREIERVSTNPKDLADSDADEEIESDEGGDVYEYEEEVPEEETGKNRRYDPVENYEYELPEKFEDENVLSDDDDDGEGDDPEQDGDGIEEDDDDERHTRMLEGITGMPMAAFDGKKRNGNSVVISEAYPESEYNPSRDVLDGNKRITIQDLLEPLQGKSGYSQIRKRMEQMEKKSVSLHAPLPKPEQEKLERKAVKEIVNKELNKWVHIVKKNREAPTVYFNEDVDLGFSTVGAIASEFQPRTEFEKKMASLVHDDRVKEAHKEDGAKLLELNEISVEDHIKDCNHIAKMRSLLFRHELKSKRIKKIKSKTYHRLKNKEKTRSAVEELMDPETAKEEAKKQEFRRAEERMTLRHKNKSKWAKRMLKLGLNARDEGTRAAIAEQLQLNAALTRKMNSMIEDSSTSSDESSDDENIDDDSAGTNQVAAASKLLAKAKEKTLQVLEEDEELPKSGVLSLPFMVRGMKKRNEAAIVEAKQALKEYEKLDGTNGEGNSENGIAVSGRRVFGMAEKEPIKTNNKTIQSSDNFYDNSDSEDESGGKEDHDPEIEEKDGLEKDCVNHILPTVVREANGDSELQNFSDITGELNSKTTYDVAIFASGSWRKMKDVNKKDANIKHSTEVGEPTSIPPRTQDLEETRDEESDSDSEGQMVEEMLTSGPKATYKLPSQEEVIRQAFVGDDVEEEFEKDKQEVLNGENPEPEKPMLLPGWGQWTRIQQKRGLPTWMLKEHEAAQKKREQALKQRKDAHLKHVILSERIDKKAGKLHTKTLPFPFKSKEAYEQSIRVPIGPEFHPAAAVGALNRPEVVKKAGIIIKPVKYEEVNPHEKAEEQQWNKRKQKQKKKRKGGGAQNQDNTKKRKGRRAQNQDKTKRRKGGGAQNQDKTKKRKGGGAQNQDKTNTSVKSK